MKDKATLLAEFDRARNRMRGVLEGINPELGIYPDWSVKELLAHLAGWDDATILALQALEAGNEPPLLAMRGIDFYNAQTVAERSELNYEQIVKEWELVREQLVNLLDEMPEELIGKRIVSPWGAIMPVATLIQIMIDHEEEHAEVVEARKVAKKG